MVRKDWNLRTVRFNAPNRVRPRAAPSSMPGSSVGTKLLPHIAPLPRRARSLGILSCHRTRAAPGQVREHVSLPSSTAARHISLWYTTAHHAVKACRVRRWATPCLRACEASSKPLSLHWCSMELSLNWLHVVGVPSDRERRGRTKLRLTAFGSKVRSQVSSCHRLIITLIHGSI